MMVMIVIGPTVPAKEASRIRSWHIWNDQNCVCRKIQRRVRLASGVTGDEADRGADDRMASARCKTDRQRTAGTPDELAIDVAAHFRRTKHRARWRVAGAERPTRAPGSPGATSRGKQCHRARGRRR